MGWSAIIAFLMQLFGPLIAEWLRKWLDDRFAKVLPMMPDPAAYPDDAARVRAICDAALATVPRIAFMRRSLIRRIQVAAVAQANSPRPLTPEEIADVSAAGRAAEDE